MSSIPPGKKKCNSSHEFFQKRPFGLLISRKIELLALAAFAIAMSTLFIQLKGCIEGPKVKLFPPDQVFLIKEGPYSDGKTRVRFGANMVYVNSAQKGYNGIVQHEYLRFYIGNKKYEHNGERFVEFEGSPGKIQINNPKNAKPFSVNAGDTTSHQTYFIAWPKRCTTKKPHPCDVLKNHVYWEDFIQDLKERVKQGDSEYRIEFEAQVFNEASCKTSCTFVIDKKIIGAIEYFGQYSPTCYSN
jgi:hypothetical protein